MPFKPGDVVIVPYGAGVWPSSTATASEELTVDTINDDELVMIVATDPNDQKDLYSYTFIVTLRGTFGWVLTRALKDLDELTVEPA